MIEGWATRPCLPHVRRFPRCLKGACIWMALVYFSVRSSGECGTNTPVYAGGSGDGWGRQSPASAVVLGGAEVSFSSAESHSFVWPQSSGGLSPVTLRIVQATNHLGQAVMTNGAELRVSVPVVWACRFMAERVPEVSLSIGSAGTIGEVSFSADQRALILPIGRPFEAGDSVHISGLTLCDLAMCRQGTERLGLDLDGDGGADVFDGFPIQVSVDWHGGRGDGWDTESSPPSLALRYFGNSMIVIR